MQLAACLLWCRTLSAPTTASLIRARADKQLIIKAQLLGVATS